MTISREDVLRVGKLSKILPKDEEVPLLEQQFSDILGYMKILGEVDTREVEPLYAPVELAQPRRVALRDDVSHKTCTREELLRNSPADSDEFFVVPRVI